MTNVKNASVIKLFLAAFVAVALSCTMLTGVAQASQTTKVANPVKITAKGKTVKKAKIGKKAMTFKQITVKDAKTGKTYKGKVTYKKVSGPKLLKVNKTTGKITMTKHKCVKKTKSHTIKVKVMVAETAKYKAAQKTVKIKFTMK